MRGLHCREAPRSRGLSRSRFEEDSPADRLNLLMLVATAQTVPSCYLLAFAASLRFFVTLPSVEAKDGDTIIDPYERHAQQRHRA